MGPLWQTFVTSLGVRSSIEGTEDPDEGIYDSDGAEKSLDSFVIQVVVPFGYLAIALQSRKFLCKFSLALVTNIGHILFT